MTAGSVTTELHWVHSPAVCLFILHPVTSSMFRHVFPRSLSFPDSIITLLKHSSFDRYVWKRRESELPPGDLLYTLSHSSPSLTELLEQVSIIGLFEKDCSYSRQESLEVLEHFSLKSPFLSRWSQTPLLRTVFFSSSFLMITIRKDAIVLSLRPETRKENRVNECLHVDRKWDQRVASLRDAQT